MRTFQYVKGEHLLNCPYLYLDYPKFFSKEEKFTFRNLFWWGHSFISAWILEGRLLDAYKENLLKHYAILADQGLFILMADTLWEWRNKSELHLEIRKDNFKAVCDALETRAFLKIHRHIALDGPILKEGNLLSEAEASYRKMRPIVEHNRHPEEGFR